MFSDTLRVSYNMSFLRVEMYHILYIFAYVYRVQRSIARTKHTYASIILTPVKRCKALCLALFRASALTVHAARTRISKLLAVTSAWVALLLIRFAGIAHLDATRNSVAKPPPGVPFME